MTLLDRRAYGGRGRRERLLLSGCAPRAVPAAFFGLHPFIEQNPKAVFIRRTNVPDKMHEESKLREGLDSGARDLRAQVSRAGSR